MSETGSVVVDLAAEAGGNIETTRWPNLFYSVWPGGNFIKTEHLTYVIQNAKKVKGEFHKKSLKPKYVQKTSKFFGIINVQFHKTKLSMEIL